MVIQVLGEFVGSNITGPITPPDAYRPATRVARAQVILSLVLGLSAFFIFSILRMRYPRIYVANFNSNYIHSTSRQSLPRLPEKSLFGWIPIVIRINEKQILDHAGLDAAVFLGFFRMCIKLCLACLFFAVCIISPVRYKFTGKVDLDYAVQGNDIDVLNSHNDDRNYYYILWMYSLFTYVFTFVSIYFLFRQSNAIIDMRQQYLGKQNSVTDRTIKISGIPPNLRDEEVLKRHIESLGIGEILSVVIVKEWNDLNKLFQLRKKIKRKAEYYWIKYLESNNIRDKYDMLSGGLHPSLRDSINMNGAHFRDDVEDQGTDIDVEAQAGEDNRSNSEIDSNESSSNWQGLPFLESSNTSPENSTSQESTALLPLLNDGMAKRPKMRKGLFGLFGPNVDAINYYTDQLDVIDKEIKKIRQRDYPPSSTAFITMKNVSQAQMVAQAVLDPKVNHLISELAPAPHDIIWDNMCLSRKERNLKIFLVTLVIGILSIALIFPVGYLAQLLNINSISKVWPSFAAFLKRNKVIANIVTTLLPTYLFTILNMIMPYAYIWITSKQGYTSHSDEELSSVSKNFFYIFVNLFFVFTTAGTASLSDTTKIAYKLAKSLRDLSLFYVDLIVLQGLGIFPYKLLLMGNLIRYSVRAIFHCKTPSDYLKLIKPPTFNFGLHLPQPILILIITIVYSIMSTRILTAGVIYFLVGYFVYKYQLLYACVHPPHSTGKVWPLVFRRVIFGLLIFQITMMGSLSLQKGFACALALGPLPFITIGFLWNFQKNYVPLSSFIALRSIKESDRLLDLQPVDDHASRDSTIDERREFKETYNYPHLVDELEGPLIAVEKNYALIVKENGIILKSCKSLNSQY
ncbi:Piso0_001666 [Millerozyma farinosa CBS 7064]|uniref:Piso0_001666 protein n=1 Tax=Pichia sorbitophila (strain ATCC MYA-4447 / BCRC 22081 / CBS 7064 / NBRC 10061 / NRRL Y-12695) TaxID=559304 RepID=G8YNS1_PICSO|nr:Piso0_001666 [Millerozyma farinosa CBS 7064]